MHPNFIDLDTILGNKDERYFGSRYQEVSVRLEEFRTELSADGHSSGRGHASVSHSGRWSTKGGVDALPHLSTIDVLSILFQACGRIIDASGHEGRLSFIEVQAPQRPVEDRFDSIPIEIAQTGAVLDTFTLQVAGFSASVELDLLCACDSDEERAPSNEVYRDVYRTRAPQIRLRYLDADRSDGYISVPSVPCHPIHTGVDRHRRSSMNVIDAFVGTLQVGQALLYRLDGVHRDESETLWMRKVKIWGSPESIHEGEIEVVLKDLSRVELRGDSWRLATIRGQIASAFTVECSVAHRLPFTGSAQHDSAGS